jgi:peptidoglycan hydrolase-like protein with peptidoglycan-binding domain
MAGPDIEYLQKRLRDLGYYKGPINGIYDYDTEKAVRDFQEAFGLLVDGIVGPDTYNAVGLDPADTYNVPTQGYRISVDTNAFTLSLTQNGKVIKTYPVAVGAPNTPTPLGSWRIIQKTMNPGGPFGTRWMKLNVPWGGYGIHGTDNPSSIGTAASHGCVRMYNEDVNELYDIVPLGTPVQIIGRVYTGRILKIGVPPGDDVRYVQEILQILGYYRGDIDGYYGPLTEQAVRQFQEANGLAVDGIVGPNTYEALQRQRDIAVGDTRP